MALPRAKPARALFLNRPLTLTKSFSNFLGFKAFIQPNLELSSAHLACIRLNITVWRIEPPLASASACAASTSSSNIDISGAIVVVVTLSRPFINELPHPAALVKAALPKPFTLSTAASAIRLPALAAQLVTRVFKRLKCHIGFKRRSFKEIPLLSHNPALISSADNTSMPSSVTSGPEISNVSVIRFLELASYTPRR